MPHTSAAAPTAATPPAPARPRTLPGLAAVAALSMAAAVHGQGPRVIYVDDDAPAGGDGQSWATAFRDLQDALAVANAQPKPAAGTVVMVGAGVYRADRGTGSRDSSFLVSSGVTLSGGFAGWGTPDPGLRDTGRFTTVLSGDLAGDDGSPPANRIDNARSVVRVTTGGPEPALDGLTIRGADGGAAITVSVIDANYGDSVRIRDCVFSDNDGPRTLDAYSARLEGCSFLGNRVSDYVVNVARGASRTTLAGNVSLSSGAIVQGPGWMSASLVAGNMCAPAGVVNRGGIAFRNCTIVNNTAPEGPGGRGDVSYTNCIVWGNLSTRRDVRPHQVACTVTRPDLLSTIVQAGRSGLLLLSRPDYDFSAQDVAPIEGDPRFVSSAGPDGDPLTWWDSDYHLSGMSPAIDAGGSTDWLAPYVQRDRDGWLIVDVPSVPNAGPGLVTFVDLGCFEFYCPGDFDRWGGQDILDIFAFLEAWFAGDPRADFDRVGGVGLPDVFAFLEAWFGGC